MLPQLFCEKMQRLLGAEYEAFLASYAQPRNTALRFNALRGEMPPLPFAGDAVPWEPNGRYLLPEARPGLHPWHDAGVYYLQEPSAMAPATLLDVHPGQRVLDLCAAPGGKSTQLAAALRGEGLLVSNELHPRRARVLAGNLERMGVSNALVLNEHPSRLAERFPAYFDRILVDAPCSGEGMFRKEADAVADWSPETVAMCAVRQSEILLSAARMLAPGGRLVYSTCTFAPEENEGSVSRLVAARPELSIMRVEAPWFAPGRPDWVEAPCDGLEHCFRLWPHRLRGEGHFAAVLRSGCNENADLPRLEPPQQLPDAVRAFLRENGICLPQGRVLCFGETVYWAPPELPELRGLKVLRAGLELGTLRKGRFLPAHALALWLREFPRCFELEAGSSQTAAWLRGQTLPGAQEGWVLLRVEGYSLGWARGAGGILKNHYPRGLRRP